MMSCKGWVEKEKSGSETGTEVFPRGREARGRMGMGIVVRSLQRKDRPLWY